MVYGAIVVAIGAAIWLALRLARALRKVPCPACGAPETFLQGFSDGSVIRECDRCGRARDV